MSDNPFIAHQFLCPSLKGSPRAARAEQIKFKRADARSAAQYLRFAILRFDVTILQQINGNPLQMFAGYGGSNAAAPGA